MKPLATDDELIGYELGRLLTAHVASEELDMYDELVSEHLLGSEGRKKDHPLAFGTAEIVTVLTPVLYAVGHYVGNFVLEQLNKTVSDVTDAALAERRTRLKEKVAEWVKGKGRITNPVRISPPEATKLFEGVKAILQQHKIDSDTAVKIEAALRQSLLTSPNG